MDHNTISRPSRSLAFGSKAWRRSVLTLVALVVGTLATTAQGYYTQYHADKALQREAQEWMASGEWRNGFTKAAPHATVNAVEFYQQYKKNETQWKALFQWCQETNLLTLPKGKIAIPGTNLVASIEDDTNRDLDKRLSESHYHHIDFQWVVKGSERFGIIDHYTSRANTPYKPDVIHYDYDVEKAKFYDSTPSEFFIFFPGDWHIAKIKTDGEDQNIRVVVIKVDYK